MFAQNRGHAPLNGWNQISQRLFPFQWQTTIRMNTMSLNLGSNKTCYVSRNVLIVFVDCRCFTMDCTRMNNGRACCLRHLGSRDLYCHGYRPGHVLPPVLRSCWYRIHLASENRHETATDQRPLLILSTLVWVYCWQSEL